MKNSKICPACVVNLFLTEFNKDSSTKDGLRARCKECDKHRRPYLIKHTRGPDLTLEPLNVRRRKSCSKYEKTKTGFLMRTYRNMKSRVTGVQKRKAHLYKGLPILSKDEFYEWAFTSVVFHILFDNWEQSSYNRKLTPSIDRIDSSQGYIKGNVRWLTHSENSRLGNLSRFASPTSTTISKLSV